MGLVGVATKDKSLVAVKPNTWLVRGGDTAQTRKPSARSCCVILRDLGIFQHDHILEGLGKGIHDVNVVVYSRQFFEIDHIVLQNSPFTQMKIVRLLPGLVENTTFVILQRDTRTDDDTVHYIVRMVLGIDPLKEVMVEAMTIYYPQLGKMYITHVDTEGIMKTITSNVDFQVSIIKHFFYGIHHSLIQEVQEIFFQFQDSHLRHGNTLGSLMEELDPAGFPNLAVLIYENYVFARYDKNRKHIDLAPYLDIASPLASQYQNLKIMAIRNPDFQALLERGIWENKQQMQKLFAMYTERSFCQVYEECDGYLVIVYESKADGSRVYLGHLIALLFETFMEIYDVFVNEAYRNMGVGKHLIYFVTENTTKDFVWLGVMLTNPAFFTAVQLYLKAGFYHPMVKNITPGGHKLDELFMAMVYVRGSHSVKSQKENLKEIEKVACYSTYKLSPSLIKQFYKFLGEGHEIGGSIATVEPDPQDYGASSQVQNNVVVMGIGQTIEKIRQLRTGDPLAHVVNLEGVDMEYSFHTHPAVCYRDYKSYLGWPSSVDINLVVSSFKTMKVHIVPSCEGIYVLTRSTEFHQYLNMCAEQGKQSVITCIANMVMDHFTAFDIKRFSNIEETIVRLTLKHALTFEERQELSLYKNVFSLLQKKQSVNHFLKARIDYFLSYTNNITLADIIDTYIDESKDSYRQHYVTESEVKRVIKVVPKYKKEIAILDVQFFPWEDMNLMSIHPCEDPKNPLTRSVFNSDSMSNDANMQFSNNSQSNIQNIGNNSIKSILNKNVNNSRVDANTAVKSLYFNVNDCINIYKHGIKP
jgi:ribosomal protein S18 acetylase RimI-like enzyme